MCLKEVYITYASGSADLLHAEFLSLVKHQQHQRLEQRDLQLLLTLQDNKVIVSAAQTFFSLLFALSGCSMPLPL